MNSLPEWVNNNEPTYTEGRKLSIDHDRAYHEREIWVGDNLKYKMEWTARAQKDLELDGIYVKMRE